MNYKLEFKFIQLVSAFYIALMGFIVIVALS